MFVTELGFENFRNLENGIISPCSGINVIYGENAQGKTNLLEALWLFTGGHSFRGAKDSELPRVDLRTKLSTGYFRLKLDFFSNDRDQNVRLQYTAGKKSSVINGVEKKTASALIGKVCAVIFSPEHLLLVKEGPSRRRNFIDGAICQIKPNYARILSLYNRSLSQRNALLKDISRHAELVDTLDIWDTRLIRFGMQVMEERRPYIERLKDKISGIYSGISKKREQIELIYQTSVKTEWNDSSSELEEYFQKELNRQRSADIRSGFTSVGPHRDDLLLEINGMSARIYGSQGQQRSVVLSLKLAESEILTESIGEAPLILLDDVMSELDAGRQDYLLNHLHDRQVFITCCDPQSISLMEKGRRFLIKEGSVQGFNI